MSRPARVELDAQALQHNFSRVKQLTPASKVMAVIKADGYGHGMQWVAQQLPQVDAFAVASVEEALALREAGITQDICLLSGFFESAELNLVEQHRLSPVVQDLWQLQALQNYKAHTPIDVWLKLDTGMHRLGFAPQQGAKLYQALQACDSVATLRLMTHFANADDSQDDTTTEQITRFDRAVDGLTGERSLANSAAICAWPASHSDWVRPGIMLYGASPLLHQSAESLGLKPVMHLSSAVTSIQQRRSGERIGYGGTWECPQDMSVAVVAIGYGDGYPRHIAADTAVLVRGQRVPIIGRVSMDMIMLDLRGVTDASVGDRVTLWGAGLPVDEIAASAATLSYELFCQVTARVPRFVQETSE